ncbi:MAG: immune inhibitor A domain-containing protein, partial [Planctomycetota bacterium]
MYAGTRQFYKRSLPRSALIVTLTICMAGTTLAMPPHPSVLEAQAVAKASGRHQALPDQDDLHSRGICTPDDFFRSHLFLSPGKAQESPMAGSFRVLALLVDFSDHVSAVAPSFFDTLVFDTGHGTVRDYFDEVSYGQIDLVTVDMPSAVGWTRAPQTYAYYVNDTNGIGPYPQNSQGLVEDLVDAVDGVVDFSLYDNDSDGDVDVLLVIHSGTGAELSGSNSAIWSHKWGITPRLKDGVFIQSYTIQPEYWSTPGDMTIGVYAHEL